VTPRKKVLPPSGLDATLKAMGARPPTIDELAAIRALTRAHADAGQQRRAVTYLMQQLCGVGRVTFCGENANTASFRLGSQAVGVALAQIGDAVYLSFPTHEEQTNEETPEE
jgi:hypothetical protein